AKAAEVVKREIEKGQPLLDEYAQKDIPAARDKVVSLVERAILRACQEINQMAQTDTGKAGMGTTLSLVLVAGGKAVMGHVGDSRLYLRRGNELHQLSEDHSFLNE